MGINDTIIKMRAHCETHSGKERATFSIEGVTALLDYVEAAMSAAGPSVGILQEAYKAGFLASTIGYNAELYDNFEKDPEWLGARYADISALTVQVQDVVRDLPDEFEKWWHASDYAKSGGTVSMPYSARKQLAWDAYYASSVAAAPAKQEDTP